MVSSFLTSQRDSIIALATRHGATDIRVFGSHARGEESSESDVDFLVWMEEGRSLLDHVGLWQELEELLGRDVDLLLEGGISPYLEKRILAEARPL